MKTSHYSVVILAAGSGTRMGLDYNKVLIELENRPLLWHTVQPFIQDELCNEIIIVAKENEMSLLKQDIDNVTWVVGGKTRQLSALNGLSAVTNEYVMIHDGARCYVKLKDIQALYAMMKNYDAALLMVPCTDTIKVVKNLEVSKTLERSSLYQAQTPQCFRTDLIIKAHQSAHTLQTEIYDDAMLIEALFSTPIGVVIGDYSNKKITTKTDI